ncbi:hypothetical protein MKW92_043236 [Papaver armeniacum]|nr:hypothetical protein MKW92_043236 [Papaver armeniacum]
MMKINHSIRIFILLTLFFLTESILTNPNDVEVMYDLRNSLRSSESLGWSDDDPCRWEMVFCTDNRISWIQLNALNLTGTLPTNINQLEALEGLYLQGNMLSGEVPSLSGLTHLKVVSLDGNNFTSIPSDFFFRLSSLQSISLDNNPFSSWQIPDSFKSCKEIGLFSANSANIEGKIPDFVGGENFPALYSFRVSSNKLSGNISGLSNVKSLISLWLQGNRFSGPLPDFSELHDLEVLNIRDNLFTGLVPSTLTSLKSLTAVRLSNNHLQGAIPNFDKSVKLDLGVGENTFCLPTPGDCDPRVNVLLSFAKSVEYPMKFAINWKGNDPCAGWVGIICNGGNVTVIRLQNFGLTGKISPEISLLTTLRRIFLCGNNLTGRIPTELSSLPNLELLDVSNNQLSGSIPRFRRSVIVNISLNSNIGKEITSPPASPSSGSPGPSRKGKKNKSISVGVIVGSVIGGVFIFAFLGMCCFCMYKRKRKQFGRVQSINAVVVHPRHSESDLLASNGPNDTHVESGTMVIPIQVLRNVTNNFSQENILGQGGFGTVYKGKLDDGTRIAVKRREGGVMSGKGLHEFMSEIAVLTKVRHRHLVALLGYCLDGNERLLVYEYMPQGTLSQHLFNWNEGVFEPLDWTRRLSIALDVARGVEYLHGLAQQSFIHRDLKPSNILLGDDMRAKVADFGLVRNAPTGEFSVETKLAGTIGYLAPEYAATGRVTTKVDVYSFGVILMELITGRKALDETRPEESMHLVHWFRRMHLSRENFSKAIDATINLTEETMDTIKTVSELAVHCCAKEPYQRPDMSHIVNTLSSLVEQWKPAEPDSEDISGIDGIDLDMTLPQALQKWQQIEGSSSNLEVASSFCNTQTSIPTRPSGFADTITSADGR